MTYERTTGTQRIVQKRRPWTEEEDESLRKAVEELGTGNWAEIAKEIPDRTAKQCRERWNTCLNPNLNKGPWTKEEGLKLIQTVQKIEEQRGKIEYGFWAEIAKEIPGRTAKQCRERWNIYLNPNLNKGPWTPEEDRIIIETQKKIGNQWTKIALLLPGRSNDTVRCRWYNALQKQKETQNPQGQPNKKPLRRACIYLPKALQNPQEQPTIHQQPLQNPQEQPTIHQQPLQNPQGQPTIYPQQPLQLGQGYPGQPTIHPQQPLQNPQVQPNKKPLRRACIYLPEALQNPQVQPAIHPQQPLQLGQGYSGQGYLGQPTIHQQPLQNPQKTQLSKITEISDSLHIAIEDIDKFLRNFTPNKQPQQRGS